MYESIYRQAMTKAWYLVWHNKILWVFGLLSVMIGQFGIGDFIGKMLYWHDAGVRPFYLYLVSARFLASLPASVAVRFGVLWAFLIIAILLVLLVFVSVVSQGALVAAVADWYKSKKTDKFSVAWHKGVKHFWRVLAVNIAVKFVFMALLLLMAVASTWLAGRGLILAVVWAMVFAVLVVAGFAVSALAVYTIGYIVVENKKLFAAVTRAFELLTEHFLVSIELAVLLFVVGWLALLMAFILSFLVFLPSVAIWLAGASVGSTAIVWTGLALGIFLLSVSWILTGALFNAFNISAWIYCFMKMKHTGVVSRLVYGFEKLFHL